MFTSALGMHLANCGEDGLRCCDTDGGAQVVAAAAGAGVALTLAPVNAPATIAPAARMPAAHRVLMRMAMVFPFMSRKWMRRAGDWSNQPVAPAGGMAREFRTAMLRWG